MNPFILKLLHVIPCIIITIQSSAQVIFSDIKKNIDDSFNRFEEAKDSYKESNDNSLAGFNYPYIEFLSDLEETQNLNGETREYAAALILLNSYHLKQIIALDSSLSARIKSLFNNSLKEISPASKHWKLKAPGEAPLTRMASGLLPSDAANDLYSEIYKRHEDKMVKAGALLELAKLSFVKGDHTLLSERVNELKSMENLSSFLKTELYMIEPSGRLFLGDNIPSFSVVLADNSKIITNKDMEGKFYLIDFWGTWCPPCIEEMPFLHEAYERFEGNNFEILSIAYGDKPERVARFREKWTMPWKHVVLSSFKDELISQFDVWHAPTAFLISPEGKIIAAEFMLRGNTLIETLEQALAK